METHRASLIAAGRRHRCHQDRHRREPAGAQSDGGPVVTFQPEASLEDTVGELQNQGVEVPAGISEHPWGRVATFKDSEGNDVQLYEPPK